MLSELKKQVKTAARIKHNICLINILKNMPKVGTVLDAGTKDGRYQKYINFKKIESIDIDKNSNADVIGDLHDKKLLKDNHYNFVLLTQVLEHCYNPALVIDNIHKSLKKGGTLLVSTPFFYRFHPDPNDYYRYTPDAYKYFFKKWKNIEIIPYGNFIDTIITILEKEIKIFYLLNIFSYLFRFTSMKTPSGYIVIAKK